MERMTPPKPQPLSDGLVVIFEGIDGVGKTTQLALAHKTLADAGWPVLSTRNLGGTPVGEALRKVILSSVERPPMTDLYISLAIQEALLKVIDEARAEGKIVLLDRSPLSLAAYQIYGMGVDETIGWQYVANGMDTLQPEVVLLYEMDAKTVLKRLQKQPDSLDYFENQSLGYFERVARGYEVAAQRYPANILDATQSIASIHHQTMPLIWKAISRKLQS
jgi:dTMP kinase